MFKKYTNPHLRKRLDDIFLYNTTLEGILLSGKFFFQVERKGKNKIKKR